MHTVAGDVKAIFQMLAGAAFRGKQGETNYNIEHCLNGRWRGGFPRPADAADQVWPRGMCITLAHLGRFMYSSGLLVRVGGA